MKYKTDLHCHTSEASDCASENLYDTVKKYIDCGYTSLAITNHFEHVAFIHERYKGDYKAYVDAHFDAIEAAMEAGKDKLYILPGIEIKFNGSHNEYLVFGVTREILYEVPGIFDVGVEGAHDYFASRGCLLIQAHPMRWDISLVRPQYIDGYEIKNTSPGHNGHNDIVEIIADRIGGSEKIRTAGTDHHHDYHIPDTGILTDEPIKNGEELVRILKSGNYEII